MRRKIEERSTRKIYMHGDREAWQDAAGRDMLRTLGPISREEAEYYRNLK